MTARKIINIVIYFVFFCIATLSVLSYFRYLSLNSPKDTLTFLETCRNIIAGKVYDRTNVSAVLHYSPEVRAVIDSGGSMTQQVNLNGWLAYYPVSEKFMLRDGLDYITLDLASCKDIETYKKWLAVFVGLRGKLYADKHGAKVTVDNFKSEVPKQFYVALGAGGAYIISFVLIGIMWLARRRRSLSEPLPAQSARKINPLSLLVFIAMGAIIGFLVVKLLILK